MPIFRHRIELDHPVEEVFAWHLRPGAFQRLTPPWEDVRVRAHGGGLAPGSRVELGIRKGPAELRWEVEHTELDENRLFVDEQRSGPFAHWRHEHRFEPLVDGRSVVEDVVNWAPPLGSLGETFSGPFIQRSLERLFAFRATRLRNDLALHRRYSANGSLKVAVTGSTGTVGTELVHFLRSGGHEVVQVSRTRRQEEGWVHWDPAAGEIDPSGLEGLDAVIHLAGEPIASVRWTSAKKDAILRSREEGTKLLARTLAELRRPPRTLISASGVDYYGDRGEEPLTEEAPAGEGFLAEVCRRWEKATHPARAMGIRTVHLRTGPVLSPRGGLLGTILLPFNLGLGGRLGSGRQYMSWIDMDDHVALMLHVLRTPELRGAVNATAPNPVPNASFTAVLGRVMGRPTVLPVPAAAIRILLGEMGRELLLSGQRVLPQRVLSTGYRFLFHDLEDSLRHQLGRPDRTDEEGGG
jgi:uncharacterized protein